MSHKMLRSFIVKVSVLGYFPLHSLIYDNTPRLTWHKAQIILETKLRNIT